MRQSKSCARFLTYLFTHSRHLHSFSITLAWLLVAFMNYDGLDDQILDIASLKVLKTVQRMRSKPRKLRIYHSHDEDPLLPNGPFFPYLITHPQLEELELSARPENTLAWTLPQLPFQWLNIRTLDAQGSPPLHVLTTSFPDIRVLYSPNVLFPSADDESQWAELDHLRDGNHYAILRSQWQIRSRVKRLSKLEDEIGDPYWPFENRTYVPDVPHFAEKIASLIECTKPVIFEMETCQDKFQPFWDTVGPAIGRHVKFLELTLILKNPKLFAIASTPVRTKILSSPFT